MRLHRHAAQLLIAASALAAFGGCATLNPAHVAKFTFEGTVKDSAGKPVPNAWVKVRGWETVTDAQGKWHQDQVVNCGALHDHVDTYEENDALLVTAPGFQPAEEKFIVKHPAWFQSCTAEQRLVFDTVLQRESAEKTETREAAKPKTPQESPAIPWPQERRSNKPGKGKVTL